MSTKDSRTRTTLIAILIMIIAWCVFIPGATDAQGSAGPKTVSGRLFNSAGDMVGDTFNGAQIELHIMHDNEESIYLDLNGLENGWYSVTIPPGGWAQGDIYWIVVNGNQWNDRNGRAVDNNAVNVTEWLMVGPGSHQLDIRTIKPVTVISDEDINIEPQIAFILGMTLLAIGIYSAASKKSAEVDVIVLNRRQIGGSGADAKSGKSKPDAQKGALNYVYEFGYGPITNPIPIGKLNDVDEHLVENSIVRVRVRGIMSTPAGTYTWYKPVLKGMEEVSKGAPLLAPDNVSDLDKIWFATGAITIDKGQSLSSAALQHNLKALAKFTLPFVILELIIGFYSYLYGYPIIPPFIGEAMILNLIIFMAGVAGPLGLVGAGGRTKNLVEQTKKKQYTVRHWAIFRPAGAQAHGQVARRLDLCGNCGKTVEQDATRCWNCERIFISSVEITQPEAEKIMGNQPPDSVPARPALGPAQTGAGTPSTQVRLPQLPPKR